MYKISDFSKLTKLTVKTLRYYDDEKILIPSYRNEENGYRYYNEKDLEKAHLIKLFRELEFSISEIKEIVDSYEDTNDLKFFLTEKRSFVENKILEQKSLVKKINTYISQIEKSEVERMEQEITIKEIESILVASIKYTGRYEDMGKYIGQIYGEIKNKANGTPFNLYYDGDYKEEAEIEVCVPISEKIVSKNVNVRELPKIKAVSIIHYGSYDTLNSSYKLLVDYIEKNNLESYTPSREIYYKGPGMIFKGNPEKYKTELIIPIK